MKRANNSINLTRNKRCLVLASVAARAGYANRSPKGEIMKPLFTVHAGEYLVGAYIEHFHPRWSVWVPSKDTGIVFLWGVVTEMEKCS